MNPIRDEDPSARPSTPHLRLLRDEDVESYDAAQAAPAKAGTWVNASSDLLRDTSVSPAARLLYLLLLDYRTAERGGFPSQERLAKDMGRSVDSVQRTMDELIAAKWVSVERGGRGHPNRYTLSHDTAETRHQEHDTAAMRSAKVRYQEPDDTAETRHQEHDTADLRHEQDVVKILETSLTNENVDVVKISPLSLKNDVVLTPIPLPLPLAKPPRAAPKPKQTPLPDGFDAFWATYPKHKDRAGAEAAWRKLRPDDETQQAILAALSWQTNQAEWLRDEGQFIPYGATYLNRRRWLDERSDAGSPRASPNGPIRWPERTRGMEIIMEYATGVRRDED